jgi:hypothetical protein
MARTKAAHERIAVTVTAADIAAATHNDPTACPIALAMGRMFGRSVSVGVDTATVIYADREDEYLLPASAQRFVYEFFAKRPVKPIRFYVTLRDRGIRHNLRADGPCWCQSVRRDS